MMNPDPSLAKASLDFRSGSRFFGTSANYDSLNDVRQFMEPLLGKSLLTAILYALHQASSVYLVRRSVKRTSANLDDAPRPMRVRFARSLFWLVEIGLLCGVACCKPDSVSTNDRLVVFAAASLRTAFVNLGNEFERLHPGVDVVFNFAGTHELRTQVEHGAEADVFASADQRNLRELVMARHAMSPVLFAVNEPVIAVSKGAASKITTFAELRKADRIVLGVPDVPIGRYASQILDRAATQFGSGFRSAVEARVVSRELNVRQIFLKISLGEADAAIVYRTDVPTTNQNVRLVPVPATVNVMAEYPIAALSSSRHPALAQAWIEFVRSQSGRATLKQAGFGVP